MREKCEMLYSIHGLTLYLLIYKCLLGTQIDIIMKCIVDFKV